MGQNANQPLPLTDYNLWTSDVPLREAVEQTGHNLPWIDPRPGAHVARSLELQSTERGRLLWDRQCFKARSHPTPNSSMIGLAQFTSGTDKWTGLTGDAFFTGRQSHGTGHSGVHGGVHNPRTVEHSS